MRGDSGEPRLKQKPPRVDGGTAPKMPKLGGCWQDLDSVEARRLQLWGERIISDIATWRHRERRRREGARS